MEASKLKISPENLQFKPMSRKKRLELRRENVKALIRARPAGSEIIMSDFAKVCATSEANVYSMVKTMVKRKEIFKIPAEGRGQRYSWAVNEGTTITSPAVKKAIEAAAPKLDTALLIEKAKEFVWEEDSDSLRHFIKWVKEEER